MTVRHTNPTRPRRDRDRREHWARAPYNFIPLPEQMVPAPAELPFHNTYRSNPQELLTGWIECELETHSPTYIRGMLTLDQFKEFGEKKPDQLSEEEKEAQAHFFASQKRMGSDFPKPTIPGSSLRGMVRTLVEVIGYGRIRYVDKKPTFTFRAVAAPKDDPLRDPYRNVVGSFGRNVKAGYLKKRGDDWYVQPALTPADLGWPNKRDAYFKVKEHRIGSKDIPGFIRFGSTNYRLQLHKVSFNIRIGRGRRGPYVDLAQIGEPEQYEHKGVLVCTGNMLETAKPGQDSPRRNHHLVLGENPKAKQIKIDPQAVKDYVNGLTPFEQDELKKDWGDKDPGCLGDDNPVFYVTEGDRVIQFGHCPNFRVTVRQNWDGATRASTPYDFIPKDLYEHPKPDLAEAIFGWVEERNEEGKTVGPKEKQRAGRVFFSDAHVVGPTDEDIWYTSKSIVPHVLSGPKPTTFQHYLVQDATKGHNPDNKSTLAHYGHPRDETQIRGHKFYWFIGANLDIEATTKERAHPKQLTRIVPLKPGVCFTFKIHFENLRPEELGVLWWVLTLPGDPEQTYRHHIGMGKPLGMGAIEIKPCLVLTDREARYSRLFVDGENAWETAATDADAQPYLNAFEVYLTEQGVIPAGQNLADVDRIQELLTMLEWREEDTNWANWTRYMEIERGTEKVNEYKERPVLPTPHGVVALTGGKIPVRTQPLSQQGTAPVRTHRETPSRTKETPAHPVSGLPQVWDLVRGNVAFIEDNGDVYLNLENVPESVLGRIIVTRLAGKQYQEGYPVTCVVISVTEEFGETTVDCEPPEVSELSGKVEKFGLGKSKSFGFIKPDQPEGAQDIFVHRSQLRGIQTLKKGQRVRFKIGQGMRDAEAKDVRLES